jgi:hypothetical protein
MKTEQQDFLLRQRYFIEQLAGVIDKPTNKHNKKNRKTRTFIRWLKSKIEFYLHELLPSRKKIKADKFGALVETLQNTSWRAAGTRRSGSLTTS